MPPPRRPLPRGRWHALPALALTRSCSTRPAPSSRSTASPAHASRTSPAEPGFSKGAFYLHFRTKEGAFHAIVERFLGAMKDQVRRRQETEARFARDHAGETGPALAARLIEFEFECAVDTETLESLWRQRDLLAAIDGAADAHTLRLMGDFRRRLHALTAARIAEKLSRGRIRRDVDPAVVADVILGTYEDYARRMAEMQEKPDLAAWTRSFLLVVYEGMLPRAEALAHRVARPPRRSRART